MTDLGKPVRRTQAERSAAMRARLSAAAYAAVAEGGLKALRMRGVAELAGVSQGALLHHFPDKNAVILAAIEHALTLARNSGTASIDRASGDREALLRAMLAEFRDFFGSDRYWVAVGITLEASKDPALGPVIRALVGELRLPVYSAWAERLVAQGWSPARARRDVRSGTALITGASVRRLWTESDEVTREIEEEWIADRLARS